MPEGDAPNQDPANTDPAAGDPATPTASAAESAEERLARLEQAEASRQRMAVMGSVLGDKLTEPLGQHFADTYSGPLEREAIKAEAERLRLVGDTALIDPNTQAGFDALLDLRAGAAHPGQNLGPHPNEVADENALAARKTGTEADALGAWIEGQARAVLAGDRRNVIDPRSPRARVQG